MVRISTRCDHRISDTYLMSMRKNFYDHRNDPKEFTNLVDDSKLAVVKKRMVKRFPKENVSEVPRDNNLSEKINSRRNAVGEGS